MAARLVDSPALAPPVFGRILKGRVLLPAFTAALLTGAADWRTRRRLRQAATAPTATATTAATATAATTAATATAATTAAVALWGKVSVAFAVQKSGAAC